MEDARRIDPEVERRRVGPGDGGHLLAAVGRGVVRHRRPPGRLGDGEVSRLVQEVTGEAQARLVDYERAVLDADAGDRTVPVERAERDIESDRTQELRDRCREWIGEHASRRRRGGPATFGPATFGSVARQ